MLGYAIGLADICVTYGRQRQTRDCLQKLHCVGNDVVLGFSGSVAIGFAMVERMRELLVAAAGTGWIPDIVAESWPQDAREVYSRFGKEESNGGCSLMMFSAHPSENLGEIGWPKPLIYTFRAPLFEAAQVQMNKIASIGSGSGLVPCASALERLTTGEDLIQLLMAGGIVPGGIGRVLGLSLSQMLRETPQRGISPHLHICFVTRRSTIIEPGNYTEFTDHGPVEFKMPC